MGIRTECCHKRKVLVFGGWIMPIDASKAWAQPKTGEEGVCRRECCVIKVKRRTFQKR